MRYLHGALMLVLIGLAAFGFRGTLGCGRDKGERVPDPPPITFACQQEGVIWGLAFGVGSGEDYADRAVLSFRARGGCLAP